MKKTALMFLIALAPFVAQAVELLRWERLPLPVSLHVGEERVVFVEREMRVGVPAHLKDRLRVQSANGAIYLRAAETFPPIRVQLQDAASGAFVLLDITAFERDGETPLEPVRIVFDPPRTDAAQKGELPAQPSAVRDTPVPILLTRFAAQNLYAPLRAIEPVAGIARVNVRSSIDLGTLLPFSPIACRALAAWRLEGYQVTAILVRNTSPRAVRLDARDLQGKFVAATLQHLILGLRGDATDTTALYLVTRGRGLAESLLPAAGLPGANPAGRPEELGMGGARNEK
ncbi:MAG: TIGR03749 family integrating conjugative element protein [Azoarcus sp.]|nr:TIGR03749 family integrating conjugative element protein [Azoarcus sp.]